MYIAELLFNRLFIAAIVIFIGMIIVLNIPYPRVNVFDLNEYIDIHTMRNTWHIIETLFIYILIADGITLLNDIVVLWILNNTHFHISNVIKGAEKTSLINGKFIGIITESFLFVTILYIICFAIQVSYFMYQNHNLNQRAMWSDLINFFSKVIMYILTIYSILLGVLHGVKNVQYITFEDVGVIIIVPAIGFTALIAMTLSHELNYVNDKSNIH